MRKSVLLIGMLCGFCSVEAEMNGNMERILAQNADNVSQSTEALNALFDVLEKKRAPLTKDIAKKNKDEKITELIEDEDKENTRLAIELAYYIIKCNVEHIDPYYINNVIKDLEKCSEEFSGQKANVVKSAVGVLHDILSFNEKLHNTSLELLKLINVHESHKAKASNTKHPFVEDDEALLAAVHYSLKYVDLQKLEDLCVFINDKANALEESNKDSEIAGKLRQIKDEIGGLIKAIKEFFSVTEKITTIMDESELAEKHPDLENLKKAALDAINATSSAIDSAKSAIESAKVVVTSTIKK
ncbi:MAG: hypothetical protein LBB21_02890 [Holosporaceae bacterium]|nr:hypothetical protein [Holosporaceae bacterium]